MKVTFAKPSDTYLIELTSSEITDLILNGSITIRPEHISAVFKDDVNGGSFPSGGHQLTYKDSHTRRANHIQFMCIRMDREE